MVPADSRRIPRAPRYSGYRYASCRFVYASFTLCGGTFQNLPLTTLLATSRSYYPDRAGTLSVWAAPRSLATTWGITNLFSFPPGTKMFQFPGLAPHLRWLVFNQPGCPIRRSAGQGSFAPHRGFSQLITSFIACKSQGIRHTPFPTFFRSSSAGSGGIAATVLQHSRRRQTSCILSAVLVKSSFN